MSDVNRTSAGEQARADALRAAQKKVKTDPAKASGTQTQSGQQGAKGTEKNMKSAFDNVLDSMADNVPLPMSSAEVSKFDAKLSETRRDDDHDSHDDSGDDDDRKVNDRGEKSENTREGSGAVKGRVSAKQSFQGQGQGGGSEEGQEGDSQKKESAHQTAQNSKDAQPKKGQEVVAPSPIFSFQKVAEVQAAETAGAPRELPKAVLDQIVQSVTMMRSKELGEEIQIDFHDNFYNGLKLRVSSKNKEISIEFIVPNRDVETTFKEERDKIAAALGEKNIDVRSIQVTLS